MGINIRSVRGDSHQPSRAWNPRPVICIYLYFPHPFPLLDYLNHFEKIITFSPAPPIFSPWAAAQDRWRLGQVWWRREAQCLTPFVVHPASLSQLLGVD